MLRGARGLGSLCLELVAAVTGEALLPCLEVDLGAAAGRGLPQPDLSLLSRRTLSSMWPWRAQLSLM